MPINNPPANQPRDDEPQPGMQAQVGVGAYTQAPIAGEAEFLNNVFLGSHRKRQLEAQANAINSGGAPGQGGAQGAAQAPPPDELSTRLTRRIKKSYPLFDNPVQHYAEMSEAVGDIAPKVNLEGQTQTLQVDTSQIKDAIDQFAKAKVNAAKQGALTGKRTADLANQQLLSNALTSGLFQAVTGQGAPANQFQQRGAAADRSMRELAAQQQRAQEVQAMAPAEAAQQKAQVDMEVDRAEQQSEIQANRFNAQVENQQKRFNTQNQVSLTNMMMQLSADAQNRVAKEVGAQMESYYDAIKDTEGAQGWTGPVSRFVWGTRIAREQIETAKKINDVVGVLDRIREQGGGGVNEFLSGDADWSRYAAHQLAPETGMDKEQIMEILNDPELSEKHPDLVQKAEAAAQQAKKQIPTAVKMLKDAGVYTPSQGWAPEFEEGDTISQHVKEYTERMQSKARDAAWSSFGAISQAEGVVPYEAVAAGYQNMKSFLREQTPGAAYGFEQRRNQQTNANFSAPQTGGSNVQGDLFGGP